MLIKYNVNVEKGGDHSFTRSPPALWVIRWFVDIRLDPAEEDYGGDGVGFAD